MRPFRQVDVFTSEPTFGNPVAVVLDAEGMTDTEMAQFANWTNLSETTFVLPPIDSGADYRVRIFTPGSELPFAGHPTIGTCHAWLETGGVPKAEGTVVQECGVGLVALQQKDGRLAFAAPPLVRAGPVSEEQLEPVCAVLDIDRSEIIDAQWADNGPGWIAVMLADADAVLALQPNFSAVEGHDVGVVGQYPVGVVGPAKTGVSGPANDGEDFAIEVRAFFRAGGQAAEDPVTGSLNAAIAQWLLGNGTLEAPYVARQGTALGRRGYVHIDRADGEIWVGGDAVSVLAGDVTL